MYSMRRVVCHDALCADGQACGSDVLEVAKCSPPACFRLRKLAPVRASKLIRLGDDQCRVHCRTRTAGRGRRQAVDQR